MTQLMDTRTPRSLLRSEVERELQVIFSRSMSTAESYGPDFSRLWTLASRHVRGGKLVRPLLLLETYDALCLSRERVLGAQPTRGPNVPVAPSRAEVIRIAAAVETLHYAFLLHDDVIDGDFHRRGHPNLIGELAETSRQEARPGGVRHWAQTGGILAGNMLLSSAHQSFARAQLPAESKLRLLDVLEHTVVETTAGEFMDVGLGDGIVSADLGTVLTMAGRKTACYSFGLPLRAASILAGGSTDLEHSLGIAGSHIGLAYQLQDDLLSTFGDAGVHGKGLYSDLREGKQTALICFARTSGYWPVIQSALGDPDMSVHQAEHLRDLLRECGAEDFVQGLIREQVDAASAELSGDGAESIPAEVQEVVRALLARIDGRLS
ncbi:MAG: polyprenyl synthetase family protein [Schumannella sp.]